MNRMNFSLLLLLSLLSLSVFAGDDESAAPAKPAYLELQPSIVANMAKGAKHVRFDVQLMLEKEQYLDTVKPHVPALINEMLLLVSDQDGAVLKTPAGKESFRQSAKDAANKILKELMGEEPVRDLFFTAFFVR
jgi:flagellar FliL protein